MSYTSSKSQSGFGTTLSINTGTISTPTWTVVDEIVDLTQSGTQNDTDDTTNLQSAAREFIPTILTPGSWEFTMNRVSVSSAAGQAALTASFYAATLKQYKITYPINTNAGQSTAGDTEVFLALVEKLPKSIKVDKKIFYNGSLKISGAVTPTEGS